jgi:hypothetical protein
MSTIDTKHIIVTILENDGVYPGDPQCNSVYQYTNDWGVITWAVYWPGMYNDIYHSPYCHNVVLLWSKESSLTQAGKDLLTLKEK